MNSLKTTLSTLCCAAALLAASTASAQQVDPISNCMVDTDCQNGWSCEVIGGRTECPEPAPGDANPPACQNFDLKECVPPPPPSCDPNVADPCADPDHVCVTDDVEDCSEASRTGSGQLHHEEREPLHPQILRLLPGRHRLRP